MGSHEKRALFGVATSLGNAGRSYVMATVVRREGLSSAHTGDMAIITEDGEFHGWVGGGCTRPTVEREAAQVLLRREPRLVVLSPDAARDPRPGVVVLPMTCHSGGTVEIYLDPVIAPPRVALFGRSPIITKLAALAHATGYHVDVADPDARAHEIPGADRVFTSIDAPELAGASFAIVGTMGDFDEEAAMCALALGASYVGVIASRRRFALLRDTLAARGVVADALSAIVNPAGLDLGAREPGEVAVSILAQIIARRNAIARVAETDAMETTTPPHARHTLPLLPPSSRPAESAAQTAIDPVCKMTVTIATAKHVAEWDGHTWYFCCGGCKTRFLAQPSLFAAAAEAG